MHTSTRLSATDFRYERGGEQGCAATDFATFCPNYHPQDRVGVVSVQLEDGVLHTSHALLAMTTTFYDHLRATQRDFFDYPQHFAFVGAPEAGGALYAGAEMLPLATPQLWHAWSWLDVWPDAKWVTAAAHGTALLQRVFDYQINRLFWPRTLTLGGQGDAPGGAIPGHVWKMLRTSLKAVYLYGDGAGAEDGAWAALAGEEFSVHAVAAAQEIVHESVVQLPANVLMGQAAAIADAPTTPQVYTRVDVQQFLAVLQTQLEGSQ